MNERVIGVYGTGGCGRGIMPMARRQYPASHVVFVDDTPQAGTCNGHPVLSFAEFSATGGHIAIAVAAPAIRRALAEKCENTGLGFVSIIAEDVVMMDDISWQPGSLFSPRVTLTSNIRIGAHFHCNLYSYVEHDCVLGDFVTFAPGVHCNGAVTIGDGAYIGAGALIRQGIAIGAGAVVGMGAVVVKDVAPGATVVGNPARPIA